MVAPIYITKCETKKNTVSYHVEAPNDHQNFYIEIDISNKILVFFKTDSFENPIKSLDLSGSDVEFSEIQGLNSAVTNYVIAKVFSAITKNEFPENMSYNFH